MSELRANEAVDAPEEDLEDLFENAPCGYLSMHSDGRIVKVNATFCQLTGYLPENIIGKRFSDLLNVGGRMYYETHLSPLLRMQGRFQEIALKITKVDGEKLSVLANALERRDADGNVLFIRVTVFQATERSSYERELLSARASAEARHLAEQEASALREQFIAVLGHDLRNPLGAMFGGIEILSRLPQEAKAKMVLGMMRDSVKRMGALIDDVLDFARGRLGSGIMVTPANIDLKATIIQAVDELRLSHPDRLIVTEIDVPLAVSADGMRLSQLVSNLLGNALTYGAREQPITVGAKVTHDTLELWIANGGEPISEAAMVKLFQPFFRGEVRESQQGLGLGLHIASEIAKAHGGTLSVTSNLDETRFTFVMPLV